MFIGTYFANNETKWFGTDCRLVFNVIGSFGFPTLHRPQVILRSINPVNPGLRASMVGCVCSYFPLAFSKHHDDGETNRVSHSLQTFWDGSMIASPRTQAEPTSLRLGCLTKFHRTCWHSRLDELAIPRPFESALAAAVSSLVSVGKPHLPKPRFHSLVILSAPGASNSDQPEIRKTPFQFRKLSPERSMVDWQQSRNNNNTDPTMGQQFQANCRKNCGCLNVWVKKILCGTVGKNVQVFQGFPLDAIARYCKCTRKPYQIGHGEKRLDRRTKQMQNTHKTKKATTIHQSKQNQLLQLQDHTSLDAMCEGWGGSLLGCAWFNVGMDRVSRLRRVRLLLLGNILRFLLVDYLGSFISVLCWIIFSTWSPSHLVAALPEQKQGGNLLYSNWCHIDALLSKNILTTVETCYKLFCLKAPIMINLARCCCFFH